MTTKTKAWMARIIDEAKALSVKLPFERGPGRGSWKRHLSEDERADQSAKA